ncbi:hypothetical protein [Nocardia sp. NPDC049149]|uniref:hypothetical protein n=1 Tax=Nocardia sp. NPDC049149 TaxID=3364315 RepID=UPI0037154971
MARPTHQTDWRAYTALTSACVAALLVVATYLVASPFEYPNLNGALIYYLFPAIPGSLALTLAWAAIRAHHTEHRSRPAVAAFIIASFSVAISLGIPVLLLSVLFLRAVASIFH